jgi:hypothetical protein
MIQNNKYLNYKFVDFIKIYNFCKVIFSQYM